MFSVSISGRVWHWQEGCGGSWVCIWVCSPHWKLPFWGNLSMGFHGNLGDAQRSPGPCSRWMTWFVQWWDWRSTFFPPHLLNFPLYQPSPKKMLLLPWCLLIWPYYWFALRQPSTVLGRLFFPRLKPTQEASRGPVFNTLCFLGDPVFNTLTFHWKGYGFNLWLGN